MRTQVIERSFTFQRFAIRCVRMEEFVLIQVLIHVTVMVLDTEGAVVKMVGISNGIP